MPQNRSISCVLALVAGLAACGSVETTSDDQVAVDAAAPQTALTCSQMLMCLSGCQPSSGAACPMSCVTRGSTAALPYFQALLTCSYTQCEVPASDGTTACTSTSDTSPACSACLASVGQGAACLQQSTACLNN